MTDPSHSQGPAPSPWRRPRQSDPGGTAPPEPPAPSPDTAPPSDAPPSAAPTGAATPSAAASDDRRIDGEWGDQAAPYRASGPPSEPSLPFLDSPGVGRALDASAPTGARAPGPAGVDPAVAQGFGHRSEEHRPRPQPPDALPGADATGRASGGTRAGGRSPRPTGGGEVSSTGLSPRVAGVLCYAAGWVSGLVMLAMERESPFVRFHAYQAVAAFGGLTVIAVTCWLVAILMAFISPRGFRAMAVVTQIAWIALGVTWLFAVVEVSQGKRRKLPLVGKRAERAAAALPRS